MEKKTRTIGILLLVLLVLLITFFGLKKWNTSKSETEEKKKENAHPDSDMHLTHRDRGSRANRIHRYGTVYFR